MEGWRSLPLPISARLQKKIADAAFFCFARYTNPRTFALQKDSGVRIPTIPEAKKKVLDHIDLGLFSWLGWRDSNPRMPVPKTGALPLGDIPIHYIGGNATETQSLDA